MLLWKIRDVHWIINLEIVFKYETLKINQLNTSNTSEILQELIRALKSQGELILYEPPDIGSPLAFPLNETLSFNQKCQNYSCVVDLGN